MRIHPMCKYELTRQLTRPLAWLLAKGYFVHPLAAG